MVLARRAELQAVQLATDVKSLKQAQPRYSLGWSSGQSGKTDFFVEELRRRLLAHRIRPLRIALKKSTGRLVGFRSSFR